MKWIGTNQPDEKLVDQGRKKMLVLSRREGEAITLEDGDTCVTITIEKIRDEGSKRCSISIEAPPSVTILRNELLDNENELQVNVVLDD